MQPFIFDQWHAWQGASKVMLSNETAKKLYAFDTLDAAINWLYVNGAKTAARALSAHKGAECQKSY